MSLRSSCGEQEETFKEYLRSVYHLEYTHLVDLEGKESVKLLKRRVAGKN